jgi:hypothetical protein
MARSSLPLFRWVGFGILADITRDDPQLDYASISKVLMPHNVFRLDGRK